MKVKEFPDALTYDDVLLRPRYSEILPSEADLATRFSRRINLKIPLISAAMDTVTEHRSAIVMAQEGGIGIIHKNMTPLEQAQEVGKVKKFEAGIVLDPITVGPTTLIKEVYDLIDQHQISSLLVVENKHKLIGILTHRDLRFQENPMSQVKDLMTHSHLITAPEGTTLDEARSILRQHRVEKLPIVDKDFMIKGLFTIKDIERLEAYPLANKDSMGRLRVAAAISVGEKEKERAHLLVQKEVDALVVDTAHGHSKAVMEMVKYLKNEYPHVDIVAGNIATKEAARDLIESGADAVKVGVGPGSICTTRVVAGIGMPQFSAVMECAEVCRQYDVPLIADGGVRYSGDITKALGIGASSVMIGSLFAGTDESPGETVFYQGRTYKIYRGMGSLGAMNLGSKDRYGQAEVKSVQKLVPEGIEGEVPYRGSLSSVIFQLCGGIRSGMGYVGARNMAELLEKAEFVRISNASLQESHPHDIRIVKEAPNYSS